MPRKLAMCAVVPLAVFALALAACGDDDDDSTAETESPASFPLTLESSDGETLTLEEPPQRIMTLSAHATQIVCGIGAGDDLVAVEQYANCPEGSDEKPALDAYQPNLEAMVGYEPDLVFISQDVDGIVGALRRTGTAVLYLDLPLSIDGIYDEIEMFGRITGREGEAADVITDMRDRIGAIEEELADLDQGPRIFHELDPLLYTAAPDSFIGELYTLLKAENIAEGAVEAYPQLSAEVVVERDPEVIILADEDSGVTAESVASRPGWNDITAIREGRICVIDPNQISQPAPSVIDALEDLAACIYPDRFS